MSTLSETIKDVEHKKRQLEESVDSLNEECAQLKAQRKHSFRIIYSTVTCCAHPWPLPYPYLQTVSKEMT